MATSPTFDRWLAPLAFLAGLAVAAGAVLGWRLPAAGGTLGVDLTVVASAAGPVDVSPAGPVLRARAMIATTAARAARGELTVTNRTSRPLRVRVRGLASRRELDRQMFVRIAAGDAPLFIGTQGQLRRWTRRHLILPPGARRELMVSSWLGRAPTGAAAASIEDLSLELEGRPYSSTTCVAWPSWPGWWSRRPAGWGRALSQDAAGSASSTSPSQPPPWTSRPPGPSCRNGR